MDQRKNDNQASPRDNYRARVDHDGLSFRLASLSIQVLRDQKALLFLRVSQEQPCLYVHLVWVTENHDILSLVELGLIHAERISSFRGILIS